MKNLPLSSTMTRNPSASSVTISSPSPSPSSSSQSSSSPSNTTFAAFIISGTSSGVGKTTVTVGLMAAFASRGHIVQPFKVGPDFLDGMHHEAAIQAGQTEYANTHRNTRAHADAVHESQKAAGTETHENTHEEFLHPDPDTEPTNNDHSRVRKCVNLDGWMMGSTSSMIKSFHRHSIGADICIIEGCMGLHDSKDGTSDEGSTAQIAKLLQVPVVLVVDGSMMARSVAAMALGYALYDANVRLGALVVNKVGGPVHIHWIREAVEKEGRDRLKDCGTGRPVSLVGALPNDTAASVPERHLGLTMPAEKANNGHEGGGSSVSSSSPSSSERFIKLACLVEEHLDLDALLELGRTCPCPTVCIPSTISPKTVFPPHKCRIGIADDEAFCFYYLDNLHLLRMAGAQLIPFSPLRTPNLPPHLDGIYMGGGYPELHAAKLEANASLRRDIRSFSQAGGTIFAECGGFMYLATELMVSKDEPSRDMCGVFPLTIRMTPHAKMYYAKIEFSHHQSTLSSCESDRSPRFPPKGGSCRGQRFHFSEVLLIEDEEQNSHDNDRLAPLVVTPLLPGATAEKEGYFVQNTVASYFHLHFVSFRDEKCTADACTRTLADHFVDAAIVTSPYRKADVVSFVSAATEIVFALGAESRLAGLTSVCDYPPEAQCAPRQIVCRSPIDASTMSSEEVEKAMQHFKMRREKLGDEGPPGHWFVDTEALKKTRPSIAFVQNTCDICDPSMDDVLYALDEIREECTNDVETIQIAPTTIQGIFQAIKTIATSLDVPDKGKTLINTMNARLRRIEKEVIKSKGSRPKVLSLEGLAPLCTGGHWLPDMKYASGCVDALGDQGGCPARIITWEEILRADPDILVISPCSASPARTLNETHLLASTSEFWKLRCVQKGEVYIIDHGCFSRPGPRIVDGVEMMAALFRNIAPPKAVKSALYSKWAKDALKYQCQTKNNENAGRSSASHCTTELSSRFDPCFVENEPAKDFGNNQVRSKDETIGRSSASHCTTELSSRSTPCFDGSDGDLHDTSNHNSTLDLCRVTRCTIPNSELPLDRSAHCIVPIRRRGHKRLSLLLFGGESHDAKRLADTWELHAPADGWSAMCRLLDENDLSIPKLGTTPTWEKLMCGKVAGEDVPTPRSNHAMVACGEHILVFGGWSVDNMTPLSHCELLHSDTLCWTHCSTRGSLKPGPRGNPTLVYQRNCNRVVLFGGWNGVHALDDLWFLDMNTWQWIDMSGKKSHRKQWPKSRTDHTSVLWEKDKEIDVMLVFGGNIEGTGPCSELWALDFCGDGRSNPVWCKINVHGPSPTGRTSHTSAIVGRDQDAKMVIIGGTTSERGTGPGSMLCDAWILHLSGMENKGVQCWIKLDWSGNGLNRCRQSISVVNDNTIIWWGGYDGEVAVSDGIGVWRGDVNIAGGNAIDIASEKENQTAIQEEEDEKSQLQERWQAEVPIREEDLPLDILEKAKRSRLPGALYKAIHRHAVAKDRDTYIDPASGYSVFSSVYLKRRPCCGNGCRHCPHGHINVPGTEKDCPDKNLDW